MKVSISLVSAAIWTSVLGGIIDGSTLDRRDATADADTLSKGSCATKKVNKTLKWDYFIPPWPNQSPRYLQYHTLETPGSGEVWRDTTTDTAEFVSRRILFENGQGWQIVNCTWKYETTPAILKGCDGVGLLHTPTTKPGDAPSDIAKIGTLSALPFGGVSPWAVYDLVSFKLSPVVEDKFLKEQLTASVFGWHDDGSKTNSVSFKIKGSDIGYLVSLPKNGWGKILQWQVRVSWGSGGSRQDFPFVIDDVTIDEYAVPAVINGTKCSYSTQTPTSTAPATTLKFDDITTLPTPYKTYTLTNWALTNAQSYPNTHPGSKSATSKPNALYASNAPGPAFQIYGKDFLFDTERFHLTIDYTATSTTNPADLQVTVQSYGPCMDPESGIGTILPGQTMEVTPTEYAFDVDTKAFGGFQKMRMISVAVWDVVGQTKVPFWVDGVVVRSWKDGLRGVPACERCSARPFARPPLNDWCEYPFQIRV